MWLSSNGRMADLQSVGASSTLAGHTKFVDLLSEGVLTYLCRMFSRIHHGKNTKAGADTIAMTRGAP